MAEPLQTIYNSLHSRREQIQQITDQLKSKHKFKENEIQRGIQTLLQHLQPESAHNLVNNVDNEGNNADLMRLLDYTNNDRLPYFDHQLAFHQDKSETPTPSPTSINDDVTMKLDEKGKKEEQRHWNVKQCRVEQLKWQQHVDGYWSVQAECTNKGK